MLASFFAFPDPSADLPGYLNELAKLLSSRSWVLLVCAVLLGVVTLVRKVLPLAKWVPWLGTRLGGWVLNFGLSLLGGFATYMLGGLPLWDALVTAVVAALAAAGAVEAAKDATAAKV